MKNWLKSLLLAIGVLSLAACGGGSNSTPTGGNGGGDGSTTVTLNGLVYDEELADATVNILLNGVIIGTATTNQAGEYSIELSVDDDDLGTPIVIEASRGSFFLASLPGSLQKLVDAAQDGVVNSDVLPGLNVTNVSTAQYVLIVQNNEGQVPSDQGTIDTVVGLINSTSGLLDLILEIAAAIKVIIDAGVELPSGLSNTLALAEALTQEVRDTEVEQFMTDNSTAISEAETAIQEDPILGVQINTVGITASDLSGKTFIIRDRTDLLLSFDPIGEGQTGGAVDVYAFATVSDYLRGLADDPREGGAPGQWSLMDSSFTLNFTDRDNEIQNLSFTVTGGTTSVINIIHAEFGSFTLHEIDRSIDAESLPIVVFGMSDGRNLELPSECNGGDEQTAFNRRDTRHVKFHCDYDAEVGAFVLTPYQLVISGVGGFDIQDAEPRFDFPLKGSNESVVLFTSWVRQITMTDGVVVQEEEPTTIHSRMRLPVNRSLPTAGATTLRIDSSGRMSINEIDGTDPSQSTVYQLNGYFLEEGELVQDVTETPRTIAADGYAGIDIVTSTSDIDDSMVHVFALSGGTLLGEERIVRNAATLYGGNNSNNFSRTRIEYLMGELVVADLGGKTFHLTHFRAEDVAATGGQEIIATFGIDYTGSFTSGDEGGEFTWAINSRGALVVTMPWEDDGEEGTDILTFYKAKLDIGTGKALMAMYSKEDGAFGPLDEVNAFIFTDITEQQ